MIHHDPETAIPDLIQGIRNCISTLTNTYGQRADKAVPEGKAFVLIEELAAVALIGALETKPDFSSLVLLSHKLPITTTFEEIASDTIAHDNRIERSEKIVAGKVGAQRLQWKKKS